MHNIAMKIAYDGTNYHGYQEQPGFITVEEELRKAVEKTVRHPVKLFMAGRTDKGVHALGQTVNFYSETTINIGNLLIVSKLEDMLSSIPNANDAEIIKNTINEIDINKLSILRDLEGFNNKAIKDIIDGVNNIQS